MFRQIDTMTGKRESKRKLGGEREGERKGGGKTVRQADR